MSKTKIRKKTYANSSKHLHLTKKKDVGRSNGKISVRHKRRGALKKYRIVDFKRQTRKQGIIKDFVYDPNRNLELAHVVYEGGLHSYILKARGMNIGDNISSYDNDISTNAISPGNALPLSLIPVGTNIHNIEIEPGRGGVLVRSAGTLATVLGFDGNYAIIKLPSKQTRLINIKCKVTIGELSNEDFKNRKISKAGKIKYLGKRPTVRGRAMNAVDHPMGGGEGKGVAGHVAKDRYGNIVGKKTRRKRNKYNKFILVTRKGEKVV